MLFWIRASVMNNDRNLPQAAVLGAVINPQANTIPDSTQIKKPSVGIWRRFRRHPGAMVGSFVLGLILLAVLLVTLSPYDPFASHLTTRFQPPSIDHPMGTDALGRDMLTRVLYGGRISLVVGGLVVLMRTYFERKSVASWVSFS